LTRIVGSLSHIDVFAFASVRLMKRTLARWLAATMVGALLLPETVLAESSSGPYARIAVLRPNDGDTVDFEAATFAISNASPSEGSWTWYGWTVWSGERQRWFVYATFGHTAASLSNSVSPAEDERDNIANVTPHALFAGNGLYEYLPRCRAAREYRRRLRAWSSLPSNWSPGSGKAFEARAQRTAVERCRTRRCGFAC
jgi:hypothetical protein